MENGYWQRWWYWKPYVSNFSALSVPKISKAVAAPKKYIKDTE